MLWRPKLKNWGWAIKIAGYTAVLDACVLYPAPLRDFLIELSGSGIYRARWSDQIHDEWIRNLLVNRPDLTEARLHRTRDLMNQSVLGARVENFESLIAALSLPDPDDRHVLAAAIHCRADAIVTFNRKDFPDAVAQQYDIEILHPDAFLYHQLSLDLAAVLTTAFRCRSRLKNPTKSAEEYLDTLERQGLSLLVSELRDFQRVI